MKMYKSIVKISLVILGLYSVPIFADDVNNNTPKNEATVSYIYSDCELKSKINDELTALGGDLVNRIELAVQDARIIAIGYVCNQGQHDAAIDAIKRVGGYRELIDRIEISNKPDTPIRDAVTTGKMKIFLATEDGDYAVTTVNRVIYIIGSAKSEQDERKIIDYAKSLSNVNKVVSYIKIYR